MPPVPPTRTPGPCSSLKVVSAFPTGISASVGVAIFFTEEDILEIKERSRKEKAHIQEKERFT